MEAWIKTRSVIVLNNEEKILYILEQLQGDINKLKSDVNQLNNKVDKNHEEVISKLNMHDAILTSINDDIRELTINQKLIQSDTKFIKHKLHKTEEEVFDLKDQLKLVK